MWRGHRWQLHNCATHYIDEVIEQLDIQEGHHQFSDVLQILDITAFISIEDSSSTFSSKWTCNFHISSCFSQFLAQKPQYCDKVKFKSTEKTFYFSWTRQLLTSQDWHFDTTNIVYLFHIQFFSAQFLQFLITWICADVVHTVNINFVILILYN